MSNSLLPSDLLNADIEEGGVRGMDISEPIYFQNMRYVYELNPKTKQLTIYLIGGISYLLHEYMNLISVINSVNEDYDIHFYINSPGGVLDTTYPIISALHNTKAKVITHNTGLAASCGSLILCCGDEIEIFSASCTMFHMSASGGYGNTSTILADSALTIQMIDYLGEMFIARGVLTEAEFKNITENEREYYFNKSQMDARLESAGILYKGGVS